ncbi:alpha/beta hydrolase family protein [Curtobacterium flaccumfaciens pv. beticola]|uniref:alpha/beta hydrolase n=1 Tax=Curtobacterium flaccumfaciens TaxID=2035 RepID=UPI00349F9ACC|nr:alpha/beta hydrolase family protein [Curtobacterium flaccumfaciens pv. basellae]
MGIEFDEAAAARLVACATEAALALRGSALPRRGAAEAALRDFAGGYARCFEAARVIESGDRVRLAAALDDLADQVRIVRHQADQERRRLADHAAWRARTADRERALVGVGAVWEPVLDAGAAVLDPEPSDAPVRPTPVSAAFRPRRRPRTAGHSGGRSSADPEHLRRFAATTRALDGAMEQDLVRLRNAWSGFTSRCGWVPIDVATLPLGFGELLAENEEDAAWAERIAEAFTAAGGGSLADTVLDAAGSSTLPPAVERLLDRSLTPAEVAARWRELGLTAADLRAFPLTTQVRMAALDGIPATMRDVVSRAVLAAALRDPGRLYRVFGLAYTYGAVSLEEFTEQVQALAAGLRRADRHAADLDAPTDAVAQLMGFGVANGAPVAAIALGNLDTATNVTVNVPGATTTLKSAVQKVRASNELLKAASRTRRSDSYAVVSWFGYRAPAFAEVPAQKRAVAGGAELASFLDGIHDSRLRAPRSVSVLGHSYGSTTAAEALEQVRHPVDNFVTYGSVGFTDATTPEHLHVDHVFATEGAADQTAILGRIGRTDPRDIPGVEVFSAEAAAGTAAVTGHDMFPEGEGQVGYLSPNATAQHTIASIIATGAAR